MSKITTSVQYIKLVSFIETHPSLAKGVINKIEGRIEAKRLWNKLAEELNALGPPIRDAEGWKKVFKDYKYHIKQKLVKNKKETTKTGGGPAKLFSFSASEEAVIAVLGLEAATGLPDTLSFGDINSNTITTNKNNITEMEYDGEEIFGTDQIDPTTSSGTITTSTPRRPTQNSTRGNPPSSQSNSENLIKRQLEIQEEFHRNLTNKMQAVIEKSDEKIRLLRSIRNIHEKKLEFLKKDLEKKEKYRTEKLQLLKAKLELKQLMLKTNTSLD